MDSVLRKQFSGDMVSAKPRLISDFASGGGGVWGGILRLLHPFSFGEIRGGHHLNTLYGNLEYSTMEYYTYNVMPRAIYTKDHNAIVERLKQARTEAGLGQVEVAEKLGRTQSYVSKIESGQRRFDVLQLKEFAKLYKKSLDYFVK
jgi:DNA-binding XRE family transcriptional regulator